MSLVQIRYRPPCNPSRAESTVRNKGVVAQPGLERCPVKAEAAGSSPVDAATIKLMSTFKFDDTTKKQIAQRGVTQKTVRSQIKALKNPSFVRLERPCAVGDGIVRLTAKQTRSYEKLFRENFTNPKGNSYSATAFIPASGAASRMFSSIADGDRKAVSRFCKNIKKFAFHENLKRLAAEKVKGGLRSMKQDEIVRLVLSRDGLGYGDASKGVVPFHRYGKQSDWQVIGGKKGLSPFHIPAAKPVPSAFLEHIYRARFYTQCDPPEGVSRIHFTVSRDFYEDMNWHAHNLHYGILKARYGYEGHEPGNSFFFHNRVDFSVQNPATDTVALDEDGNVLKDKKGRLVFRPAGHGALMENLEKMDGGIVFISNIDNIGHISREKNPGFIKRALGGLLMERLEKKPPKRPLRVCGVVKNTGEPGGGPFWTDDAGRGVTPQIVEAAQVDRSDSGQEEIFRSATHFNPVEMACWRGDFRLSEFGDSGEGAFMVTEKTHNGRRIRTLEMPGLWNGAMAGWDTVFVEIPPECFNPVKTVFDLLTPAHQDLKDG